jgi:hypothetical protein
MPFPGRLFQHRRRSVESGDVHGPMFAEPGADLAGAAPQVDGVLDHPPGNVRKPLQEIEIKAPIDASVVDLRPFGVACGHVQGAIPALVVFGEARSHGAVPPKRRLAPIAFDWDHIAGPIKPVNPPDLNSVD